MYTFDEKIQMCSTYVNLPRNDISLDYSFLGILTEFLCFAFYDESQFKRRQFEAHNH